MPMKTAEDYAHEVCCSLTKSGAGLSYPQERLLKCLIAETLPAEQLDAMKEGMRRAANIVVTDEATMYGKISEVILTAAEQLTKKDL